MRCQICGAEMSDNNKFCPACGAKVIREAAPAASTTAPPWASEPATPAANTTTPPWASEPAASAATTTTPPWASEPAAPAASEAKAAEPVQPAAQPTTAQPVAQPAQTEAPAAPAQPAASATTSAPAAPHAPAVQPTAAAQSAAFWGNAAPATNNDASQQGTTPEPHFFDNNDAPIVSVGHWLYTIILWILLPIAAAFLVKFLGDIINNHNIYMALNYVALLTGLILMFIWAFNKRTNPSKRNFFRALLIVTAFLVLLGVILALVFMDEIAEFNWYMSYLLGDVPTYYY